MQWGDMSIMTHERHGIWWPGQPEFGRCAWHFGLFASVWSRSSSAGTKDIVRTVMAQLSQGFPCTTATSAVVTSFEWLVCVSTPVISGLTPQSFD